MFASDHEKKENSFMEAVFLSSCVGYTGALGEEFLMVGTSLGEIYQM